jgi:hypothetical protein
LRKSGVRNARMNAVSMRSPLLDSSTSSAGPVADTAAGRLGDSLAEF